MSSAELYNPDHGNPDLGFDPNWQPLLPTVSPSILRDGSALTASASRFKGISEASGGNGAQNSSSNYPLVQLVSRCALNFVQRRRVFQRGGVTKFFAQIRGTDDAAHHFGVSCF